MKRVVMIALETFVFLLSLYCVPLLHAPTMQQISQPPERPGSKSNPKPKKSAKGPAGSKALFHFGFFW